MSNPSIDYAARRRDPRPIHVIIREAMAAHEQEARAADALWRSWCVVKMPRVPGCDTVYRIAVRIWCGRSVEEAAALEYAYRWSLAVQSRTFGVPHPMGM